MSDAQKPDDDDTISPETELWRRIPPTHWVRDETVPGGYRPTSETFNDPELSVVMATECHGGLETLLTDHDKFGVASFTVGEIRERGWGIVRVPDDALPGHAHVTGKKSHGKRSSLTKQCRMLVLPKPATVGGR